MPSRLATIETKNITLGELADSIITKDFSSNPLPFRPTILPYGEPIPTPADQWKRRMAGGPSSGGPPKDDLLLSTNKLPVNQMGRRTPDDRHVIRMSAQQPPSPRKGGNMYHDMVSPPDGHFNPSVRRQVVGGGQQPGGGGGGAGEFQLDRYMSSKIVEAMRTSEEKSGSHPQHVRLDDSRGNDHHMKEMIIDRSITPDDDRVGSQQQQHNSTTIQYSSAAPSSAPTVTTFAPATYAYPFSALNVVSAASVAQLSQQGGPQGIGGVGGGGGPVGVNKMGPDNMCGDRAEQLPPPPRPQTMVEPKPLLSSQYEALSDED